MIVPMPPADLAPSAEPGAGLPLVRDLLAAYAEQPRVRSVAVVGNAPLEPDDERAAAIDSADLVIRCNSFMLDRPGEPPTQGSRVHAVIFSRGLLPTEFSFARYRDLAFLVTEPSRIYAQRNLARYVKDWPTWWPLDLGFVAVPNAAFTMPLLDELRVPWTDEVVVPTTGLMAVFIAMQCFPEADLCVTGFSMIDNPDQTEWRHQAGDTSPIGGAHLIKPEGQLFRRWIDEGRVRRLS
jgi:hypothetical protein